MQSYNELNECINLCNRILKRQASDAQVEPFEWRMDQNERNQMDGNKKELENSRSDASAFFPSRTIVVQNFLEEAECMIRSFFSAFGRVEEYELIRDESPSMVAIIQFDTKASAADALLAVPYFKARGNHLAVHLLWNGPYNQIKGYATTVHHTYPECIEKRVVFIGLLPRTITGEVIASRCQQFGTVLSVSIQPQEHEAIAYVTFRSPLSAAIATFCLRNKRASEAALMLGYSVQGSPVLLAPVHVRPRDLYKTPVFFFELRSIWDKFADYTMLKKSFTLPEQASIHTLMVPWCLDKEPPCVRIATSHVKGISLYIELLLIEGDIDDVDDIDDFGSISIDHKYLFRLSIDFGLHKPVLSYEDTAITKDEHPVQLSQCINWNSFFALDLQVCYPWGFSDPILTPMIQGMNHLYSKINPAVFDVIHSSTWFGDPVRYATTRITANPKPTFNGTTDFFDHNSKMRAIMKANVPLIRLIGPLDGVTGYKIPVHVYSETV